MKNKEISFAPQNIGYVSPSARIIDIASEGVLCASNVDINDWEKDEDILDFN